MVASLKSGGKVLKRGGRRERQYLFLWLAFSGIISPLLISHILVDSLNPLGMAAPSMKERQACWGARDEYWKCLDENTEDASKCKK